MVRVFICTKMGQNMRGLGLKINRRDLVLRHGWMEPNIQVNIKMD
jgi:hypothetical protein